MTFGWKEEQEFCANLIKLKKHVKVFLFVTVNNTK